MTNLYQTSKRKLLLLSFFFLSLSVVFAQRKVSGKITDSSTGDALPGASVVVQGTNVGTTSDASGSYSINVPNGGTKLTVSFIGYTTATVAIGNQSTVNVSMGADAQSLQEIVVTGYQQLRKRDITGAVTIVEAEGLKTMKASSFTQNLAGRAAGVTVSTSGSPGDATNVRVRGISSFTSNDPLYIIDGVPVQDQYQNTINPDDIESIQVLKDASTASIYGSRASNGVIVITTRRGKSGKTKVTYNGSFGLVNSVKGYDQIVGTSSQDYATAMKLKYASDPTSTPSYAVNPSALPKYINPIGNTVDESTYDILTNQISLTNQTGTNWWKEVTRTAQMHDHSLSLSGGNDLATFSISASYLSQQGVLKYTDYNRGTVRANSTFKVSNKMRIGENIMYAGNWGVGINSTGGNSNEQGPIGQILKSTPVIPITDIKGNPGGHLTASTGNFTNPDMKLSNNKNNTNKYNRLLGNVYAEYDIITGLTAKTSFGGDFGNGWSRGFTFPEPYRVEGNKTANSFYENWNQTFTWTWTNTLAYAKTIGQHSINLLAGQEAISNKNRSITGNLANYFTTDVNAWYIQTAFGDPSSRQVSSGGSASRLASLFGKIDYAFNDKYLLSATVRRDGSSKFLSDVRYGVFPAVSVGWRLSQESFMKDLTWLSDLKIRASYGSVGNQNIRDYNFGDIYGGSVGSTFYDINGTNGGLATGYALTSRGNANTVWEAAKTANIGFDAAFLNNALTVVLDVYNRNTENLLYNPALPGTAGAAQVPFINVGSMENKGFDFALGYKRNLGKGINLNTSLNVSRYKNTIKKVANNTDYFYPSDGLPGRLQQSAAAYINKVGSPISAFNGFTVLGLITTEAEKALQLPGAQIGGLKFKDNDGDGKVTYSDMGVIGSPHPDFTLGWNLGLTYKNFDFNAFTFGSFGNDIFNYTKMFTYFTNFNSGIGKGVLDIQGTGNNPKLNGLDLPSRDQSTFYVEDGTYVRLANLQVGYQVPRTITDKLKVPSARIYLQGQNLLTLTKYSGADPAVSNANLGNNSGANDLRSGFDGGNYPANKIITIGVNVQF